MKFNILIVGFLALLLFHPATMPGSHHNKGGSVMVRDTKRTVRILLVGLKNTTVDAARKAILQVPGVLNVQFSVPQEEARVLFDINKTDLKTLRNSLQKAGFTASFR